MADRWAAWSRPNSTQHRRDRLRSSSALPAPPSLSDISKAIPSSASWSAVLHGHAVWVFEGHPSTLAAGCRDADMLVVDSVMRPLLAPGWEDEAAGAMRNVNILVHDRATFQLAAIRKCGDNGDRLQFPN